MSLVLPRPELPTLAVAGSSDRFPLRRVFCVGRNYADHAREMGHDPDREPPFFFCKPTDGVVPCDTAAIAVSVAYPPATQDLHHEVELVVALAGGGRDIPVAQALGKVFGYAVGLDLTRRDLQARAKAKGHPWDMGKGFDQSAPVSALAPAADIGHPEAGAVTLTINGQVRQQGNLNQMIWSIPEVIANLSTLVELRPGDLIFTGTPAGVGPVNRGDRLEGQVEGVGGLTVVFA
ncbi:fumarylpyruvate hydrolase [Oryzomicrobium terrae]|uniref:Fumarylpyruvate hydrolase n=1 Tax=Oryzomicrobium terrae TaxID=1735038 RepID=A0A5C1EAZ0_9RHOO|nr:fumarylacetoacetate hydrolase family protein [Oryzomicrobium terrae]QEL65895.1 fumarylpyruvate hydrolase [Oryzomicrobium terrae]